MNARFLVVFVIVAFAGVAQAPAQDAYEAGGPLAGVKLQRFGTQHGEEPGFPGCLDGRTPEDQTPELELYPGAVEHYRTNAGKYTPTRSFFDRQSQIRNWVAPGSSAADGRAAATVSVQHLGPKGRAFLRIR